MPVDSSRLSRRELRMIGELVTACHYLEDIFWRQSDSEGPELYKSLEKSKGDPKFAAPAVHQRKPFRSDR